MSRRAVITGTGAVHGRESVPNAFFDARFGEGVGDWLARNLDIHHRYWCAEDESTASLAVGAAEIALTTAGVAADQVDLIIVSTDTPEQLSPSTASVVQHRLKATGAATFDLNTACAGFVTALDVAQKFIIADARYRTVLVIGAYAMSRFLDPNDKKTVTLFADGAGAAVLQVAEGGARGLGPCRLHTEGQYHSWMGIYAGGAAQPITPARMAAQAHTVKFVEKFPVSINPDTWTQMIQALCDEQGITPLDIDRYVFTQLNINSIRETLTRLGVPTERGHTIMQQVGYTGSACIPMALDDALRSGAVQPGQRVALVASGGGLSFAAMTLIL